LQTVQALEQQLTTKTREYESQMRVCSNSMFNDKLLNFDF